MAALVIRVEFIRRVDLWANRDWLFLFGDNEQRSGMGGQAKEMRGEPNALGIRTKRKPSMEIDAFWSDGDYIANCGMILEDMAKAFDWVRQRKRVVLPADGIGTGRAALPKLAPKTFGFLLNTIRQLDVLAVAIENGPADGTNVLSIEEFRKRITRDS